MAENRPFAEMLVSYAVSLHIKVSLHIITGFLAWTADKMRSCR